MTNLKSLSLAMILAAGAVAFGSQAAFARIVCNEWGQCWRVHGHYPYPGWGRWANGPYEWRGHERDRDWGEHEARGWHQWPGGHGDWEEE
jgi:hypothetical protein